MESRHSIDVLDLASPRQSHRRNPSTKSAILKALISPVKQQSKGRKIVQGTASSTRQTTTQCPPLESRHDNGASSRELPLHSQNHLTKIALKPASDDDCTGPTRRMNDHKENADPFWSGPRDEIPKVSSDNQPKQSGFRSTLSSRALSPLKSTSKVRAADAAIQGKSAASLPEKLKVLDTEAINADFEAMLDARNVAPHMREKMRSLTWRVKVDLVRQDQQPLHSPAKRTITCESGSSVGLERGDQSTKRSRPLSRTFTFSRADKPDSTSPSKKRRGRSQSRAESDAADRLPSKSRSMSRTATLRHETPQAYISYLRTQTDPTKVEVGRLHKLRILLRNETLSWVDEFIALEGMSLINSLLVSIMQIEWREEHEDLLLHETLLCLKGLCTTESALTELQTYADGLLSSLIGMLFDAEKKGPAEYTTRMVIVNILFSYLACKVSSSKEELEARAKSILHYLSQDQTQDESQPPGFVLDMHTQRPYQAWAKEICTVSREVFWIFLHQLNVVALDRPSSASSNSSAASTFTTRHFPGARPPVPAAPYIGGVEWDAAMYLTAHLDLLNGLVAALPTKQARQELRQQLQLSGFEKTMGGTLRTCKEKFYPGIHDGLRAWVNAAHDDGWPSDLVREGPSVEEQVKNIRSSPQKPGKKQAPPKLDEMKLDSPLLDLHLPGVMRNDDTNDDWLG